MFRYILRYYIDPGFAEDKRIAELLELCKKGRIEAEWRCEGGKTTYIASVPAAIDLEVKAPEGIETIIKRY